MDPVRITLIKDDEVFNVEVGFKLSREVRNTGALLCAEITPPISLAEGKSIDIIHFTDFQRFRDALSFKIPGSDKFEIGLIQNTNIKLIKPVACPQLASLNKGLTSAKDICFAHFFYLKDSKSENLNDLEFLDTVQSPWEELSDQIKTILSASRKGPYGVTFGIVKVAEKVPALRSIDSVLSSKESYKCGQKMMIILVSSSDHLSFRINDQCVSIAGLPRVPRDFILRIRAQTSGNFNAIQRWAIEICLNGGVPVHFLDSGLEIEYMQSRMLKSSDFDQIELNLQYFMNNSEELLAKLRPYIQQLFDHVYTDSSEASFRCLFWNPVMNCMFTHDSDDDPIKNFRLEAELKIARIFKANHSSETIDYTAVIKIGDEEFPIFVLGVGNASYDRSSMQKHHSKMLVTMIQIGRQMAKAMIAKGKDPEVVRVCGLWVNGLSVQFVVAHPVVTHLPDNTYEFHISLSTNPSWSFNLTDPSPIVLPDTLMTFGTLERVNTGAINLSSYQYYSCQDGGEASLDEPPLGDDAVFEDSQPSKRLNFINEDKLNLVNGFVQYCKNRIAAIKDELLSDRTDRRSFNDGNFNGIFVTSRCSSSNETRAVAVPVCNTPTSSKSAVKKTGFEIYSLKEMLLMLKLTRLSRVFPVIYEFKIISLTREREVIHYDVEQMEPVFDYQNGSLSRRIISDHPVDTFYGCLRFAIHCLYALNLLHYDFKLIHSSINPRCIVYSEVDDLWKLIDFSDSLDIGESLRTKRIAGFIGYLAPETDETDIHTQDSDVFALGKVFLNLFDLMILNEILINEDEVQVPREVKTQANLFCDVIQNMIHPDPAKRLPLNYILGEVYDILKQYNLFKNDPLYSPIRLLVHQDRQMEIIQNHFEGLKLQSAGEQVETIESEARAGTEMEIEERHVHIPETFTESDPKRPRMEGVGGEKDPEIFQNVMQK